MTEPSKDSQPKALPSRAARLCRQAEQALRRNRLAAAEELLDRALVVSPDHPDICRLMGIAALMAGQHAKAAIHLRGVVAARPDDGAAHMTLGSALFESGQVQPGLEHLEEACRLVPGNAEAWYNLGVAFEYTCLELNQSGNMPRAKAALERAVEIDPAHLRARNKLAAVLIPLGDSVAARRILRDTLARYPDCVDSWLLLGDIKNESLQQHDVEQLRKLLRQAHWADDERAALGFTLAKAQEDQADYAAALQALHEANAIKRRQVHWDAAAERARVEAHAQTFSRPLEGAADATLGEGLILLSCVPRCGATLVEQILASHPDVAAGGETRVLVDVLDGEGERRGQTLPEWAHTASSEDWQRLGEEYLQRTQALRGASRCLTDKSVDNWACMGAAMAMLPGARIVNVRRDPLETCLACYRQLFLAGAGFSFDLTEMAQYFAGYQRLTSLWRRQFPRRFVDCDYEALQRDTEARIRRLLEFCQLPFDPACLAFHQTQRTILTKSATQVRQPMQQDTARSERYGAGLDGLRTKLQEAGVAILRH